MPRQEVFDQRALSPIPTGLLLVEDRREQRLDDWLYWSVTAHEKASLPVNTEAASAISY